MYILEGKKHTTPQWEILKMQPSGQYDLFALTGAVGNALAGYGAEAINPYLAFDTLLDMHGRGEFPPEYELVR